MPIEKKDVDDRTIAEIWGQPPVDPPPKKEEVPPVKDGDPPKKDESTLDKETYEKATAAQERIEKVMEKHGFDDLDELADALQNSKEFESRLGTRDLDQLIKDADYLEKTTKWQADQLTQKQVEDEETDDKVARLEKELRDFKSEQQKEKDAKAAKEASKQALADFENLVTSTLKDQEIPDEQKPFLAEFLGVDNPMLDVDLDNKVAVRKAMKGQVKKYNDLVTKIIKGYTDGKIKIPDITPTDPTPPDPPEKVKDLKHARTIAAEILSGKFFKH